MFLPKSLSCFAVAGCFLSASLPSRAVSPKAASRATSTTSTTQGLEKAPPPEAFRVLPPPDVEGPQITPYLLYQTTLAWQQNAQRQARWSQVKTEADLKQLRAELRKSVLEMIGGLPTEKTDLHATITGRVKGDGFHVEKLLYQSLPAST